MKGLYVTGLALALFVVGLTTSPVYAARNIGTVKINVTGTVIVTASCKIGGANPIKVEYGDVYISEISGDNYRKNINYGVSCQGDGAGKTIQLQIQGSGSTFDGNLLRTDANGLGIKILHDGAQMELNKWYNLDPQSPPKLEGILVKQHGATFNNGQEFNAAATLKVAYN